jgi:hypothetical protein
MVLGYWDSWAYLGSGRLIDYWQELSKYSNGTGELMSVPNILDQLRGQMGTSAEGSTNIENIGPGIVSVANSLSLNNGYSYSSSQCSGSSSNDYCWSDPAGGPSITREIDNGRPFVWGVGDAPNSNPPSGHFLCAWGYTDNKEVITFNTGNFGRDDWPYREYGHTGHTTEWQYVDTVEPGGLQGDNQVVLDDPSGGESLIGDQSFAIWWRQWGTLINSVNLYYSADGGNSNNWILIAAQVSSSVGLNSYNWKVPNISSSKVRVKAYGFNYTTYIAGDGTRDNLTINPKPDCINIAGDWTGTVTDGVDTYGLIAHLSQDNCIVTGTIDSPDSCPGQCGMVTGPITASVNGNIVSGVSHQDPWVDCETCEIICYSPSYATLTVDENTMNGTGQTQDCMEGIWYDVQFSFTKDCPIPGTPSNPSPSNGVTGVPTNLTISWASCVNTDSYDVYFGRASDPPYIGNTTSNSYLRPLLSYDTTYYWKVVAKNNCGDSTPGAVWSFRTGPMPCRTPNPPSLISPSGSGVSTTPTLDWGDVSGATSYDVQVCSDTICSSVVRLATILSSSEWTVSPALNTGTTYWWHARANNACGSGLWSDTWSFTTVRKSGIVDFDGDGSTDVAAFHLLSDQFFTDYAGNLGQYGWGGSDCYPLVWDYDGNGSTDISVYHIPTNQWFVKGVPGDNLGAFGWGGDESVPVPGDYDGDGVMDRAFYHWPTNRWFVEGAGGSFTAYDFGWGGADCIPIALDYDGNGTTDMMLYHIPTNQWFVYGIGNLGQFGWNGSECLPVPGDWDGDGEIDLAVYHWPSNEWVWRDKSGTPHFLGQYGWGGLESFPIPGDYDGDGVMERGFYRPSANWWFIEGESDFVWGWGGSDFMPITSQMAIYNWFRFVLGRFQ